MVRNLLPDHTYMNHWTLVRVSRPFIPTVFRLRVCTDAPLRGERTPYFKDTF